jgi:ankyrin repeat protein
LFRRREEDMSAPVATEDLIMFGEVKEVTTADALIARQYREDLKGNADPRDEAIEKAIRAAKSNNVAMMEDALEEDIQIDTTDSNGNSLFMIAAQQNSKRMCKFLLRRGANINFQSTAGNTALHFCYAFDFKDLAEYLKSKVSAIGFTAGFMVHDTNWACSK